MGMLIENRPVGCRSCGFGPVNGREDQIRSGKDLIREIRWICPRCGSLVRVDEEKINEA